MNPRHARLRFFPMAIDPLTRSELSSLQVPSDDVCHGKTAPDLMRVRAAQIRDGRVAHSRAALRAPCVAFIVWMRGP